MVCAKLALCLSISFAPFKKYIFVEMEEGGERQMLYTL